MATPKVLTKEERVTKSANQICLLGDFIESTLTYMKSHPTRPERAMAEDVLRIIRFSRSIQRLAEYQNKIFCDHDYKDITCNDGWDWHSCSKCGMIAKVVCPDWMQESVIMGINFLDNKAS